jgi:peptidase S41-like protein
VVEMGDELMIWKLPRFNISGGEIDKYTDPGCGELVLSRLLISVFDRGIILGDKIQRHQTKPWKIKSRGVASTYSGRLLVLIDRQSASAAELFACVTQIEKRAWF